MNSRTRLAFFILKTHAGWIVRADGFVYPPCADQIDALAKAIREAQAAERLGFASVVLAQSAAGEPCHVRWCCAGNDGAAQSVMEPPYPIIPAMADILTPTSASEERP